MWTELVIPNIVDSYVLLLVTRSYTLVTICVLYNEKGLKLGVGAYVYVPLLMTLIALHDHLVRLLLRVYLFVFSYS